MVCAVKSVCVRADQDMLSRIHQELNARFLQDRSLLPLGLPPVPFTLHQHQHLHHHQHVLTPGTYLPNPVAQSAPAPASLFQPPVPEVNESWCLHACYWTGPEGCQCLHARAGAFSVWLAVDFWLEFPKYLMIVTTCWAAGMKRVDEQN